MIISMLLLGVVVHPDFYAKLDFEIAVDQQTKARDRTFEGVPDSGCSPVLKTMLWGALLVATSFLNT